MRLIRVFTAGRAMCDGCSATTVVVVVKAEVVMAG